MLQIFGHGRKRGVFEVGSWKSWSQKASLVTSSQPCSFLACYSPLLFDLAASSSHGPPLAGRIGGSGKTRFITFVYILCNLAIESSLALNGAEMRTFSCFMFLSRMKKRSCSVCQDHGRRRLTSLPIITLPKSEANRYVPLKLLKLFRFDFWKFVLNSDRPEPVCAGLADSSPGCERGAAQVRCLWWLHGPCSTGPYHVFLPPRSWI